ncbi:MAG: translational GTPase TypA [bacterium]|nr:translational GTPase TypA [bacterium]
MASIRNIAIIAHVDHGKTTLVDALLRQSKTHLSKEMADTTCIMDSNDLEKERGITIFSKNASVEWKGTKINIIDTPGHADFGGEVERVLKMADGALLLIESKEGPMPQTRFVLQKALDLDLKIIVVINKIDQPHARINYSLNKTFDLFFELGADEKTADFPVVYASAKFGKAGLEPSLEKMTDITPLFDAIIKYIPAPGGDPDKPLQMLITNFSYDKFKGRIAVGRIYNGRLQKGQEVIHINREGNSKKFRLTTLLAFEGLERVEVASAEAGDLVAIAGIPDITIGETLADPENPVALPLMEIEEPTVKMTFAVNSSPVGGQEGEFCTSRQIRERLYHELETDVALRVEDGSNGDWIVSGRGELHLAILIERLRREGYELQVSQPQAIIKEIGGVKMTPYERVFIEIPEIYSGSVIEKLGKRNGEMQNIQVLEGIAFLEFLIPTRGLLGYRAELMTDSHGLGVMNSVFEDFRPDPAKWPDRDYGSLVAHESGVTNLYGLLNAQGRGELFVRQGIPVYKGQIVGQGARPEDIHVNVCKTKVLSNMRSKGEGSNEHFNTPRVITLDYALDYIGDDELVEVTPKSIRLRKKILDVKADRRKNLL